MRIDEWADGKLGRAYALRRAISTRLRKIEQRRLDAKTTQTWKQCRAQLRELEQEITDLESIANNFCGEM